MGCCSTNQKSKSISSSVFDNNPNAQQSVSLLHTQSILKEIDNKQISKTILFTISKNGNKHIKGLTLLFRASEHRYSAAEFHQICDNKAHTLLIAQTVKMKIYGGYTPCPWRNNELFSYQTDEEKKSFIFSIQDKQIQLYNLKQGHKEFAIMNDTQQGPIFGKGHDLIIHDKCDKKQNWSNLGLSYQCQHKFGSQKANKMLTDEEKYLLKEYQIWQIYFQ